ncbi:MAG: hypothetical protein GY809_00010, partial [Planctomycetes bacterium]|nr:hypothetical protein [Planctomycetota bacterium]
HVEPMLEPYCGSNLFSLASGGAIYVRDPHAYMVDQQLNGGEFQALTPEDWEVMLPYLSENEQLFDIPIKDLLTVDGTVRAPEKVYRKVVPAKNKALSSKVEYTLEDDDAMKQAV